MLVSGRVDTSQSSSVDQGSLPGMHDKNYLLGLRWLSGVALPHCHSDGTASTSSQWKRRKRIAEEGLTAVQQFCGASIGIFDSSYSYPMFAKFIDFWKGKFDK